MLLHLGKQIILQQYFDYENDEIIVSVLDHHSLIMPWQNIASKKKAKLVFVDLNENNQITVENFKKCLSKNN